jgi:hypothetical protein
MFGLDWWNCEQPSPNPDGWLLYERDCWFSSATSLLIILSSRWNLRRRFLFLPRWMMPHSITMAMLCPIVLHPSTHFGVPPSNIHLYSVSWYSVTVPCYLGEMKLQMLQCILIFGYCLSKWWTRGVRTPAYAVGTSTCAVRIPSHFNLTQNHGMIK